MVLALNETMPVKKDDLSNLMNENREDDLEKG